MEITLDLPDGLLKKLATHKGEALNKALKALYIHVKVQMDFQFCNYPDSKCAWGYMTLCRKCQTKAPSHVDTSTTIEDKSLPKTHCELCGQPNHQ